MTVTPTEYVKAFERNCPHARLTKDEWEELWRLFHECRNDAVQYGRALAQRQE